MNFEFTEEQKMIRQSARDYAQRELIIDVLQRDASAEYPAHHVKALAAGGGVDHLGAVGRRQGHRLFVDDVLAGLQRRHRANGV